MKKLTMFLVLICSVHFACGMDKEKESPQQPLLQNHSINSSDDQASRETYLTVPVNENSEEKTSTSCIHRPAIICGRETTRGKCCIITTSAAYVLGLISWGMWSLKSGKAW